MLEAEDWQDCKEVHQGTGITHFVASADGRTTPFDEWKDTLFGWQEKPTLGGVEQWRLIRLIS